MPQPNGYRKALRFMKHADHFGFPIITFVDTPGAYAGKNAEELGQVSLPCCTKHERLDAGLVSGGCHSTVLAGPELNGGSVRSLSPVCLRTGSGLPADVIAWRPDVVVFSIA